ncbi:hypothetical protein ABIB57_004979 [Devosia sp. UYZn731]|uniref:hypothetical protein n=1 Tax=Devosia sp. UYZn731 TaxID=3156345 RepID=UPI00339539E0
MKVFLALIGALSWSALATAEEPFQDRAGDLYEITLQVHTEQQAGLSSGSSNSNFSGIEKVIAIRPEGVELEFDLPEETSPEVRARSWEYPMRVLKAPGKPLELLNETELVDRVDRWLELGGLSRSTCGQWIFTWTAIKIECDPKAALASLAGYDLRITDLSEGAIYNEPGTLGPVPLRLTSSGPAGETLVAELELDPALVRLQQAEREIAIAQMTGLPQPTIEDAMRSWAKAEISGTIRTTIDVDTRGIVIRRTQVSNLQIVDDARGQQHLSSTAILERKPVLR